ncbi:MAG: DUF1566 domain-containing protein [Methylococcaceae bacterium]
MPPISHTLSAGLLVSCVLLVHPCLIHAASPIALAGFDLTAEPSVSVTLNGYNSYPASKSGTLNFAWKQISGIRVTLTDAGKPQAHFQTPSKLPKDSQRQLVFRLTVTDAFRRKASDEVVVTLTTSTQCNDRERAGSGVCLTPPRFNDTGITQCSDTHVYGAACPLSLYPGQDGDYGRDAITPGQAGFRFTRLDDQGKVLKSNGMAGACIRDDVTGLIWENKTATGIHDVNIRYTRLNSDQNPASELVRQTNDEALCGYKDWRLPNLMELQGLAHYGIPFPGPVQNSDLFSLSLNETHWTGSLDLRHPNQAYVVQWDDGQVYRDAFDQPHAVRLVRGTPLVSRWFVSRSGDEVTDRTTGLTWKRCEEGTRWTGQTCEGHPRYFTWYEALQWVVPGELGWRVPNVKEMSSLIDPASTATLSFNTVMFPQATNNMFWTSSPYTLDTFFGWVVQSFYGYAYFTYLEDTGALRLVRNR